MKIEADLIVYNANIITMDPAKPVASAMAVKSYKILAVGSEAEIADLATDAKRVIDLGGKTVVPGFIDAHTHLTSAGIRSKHVELMGTRSRAGALKKVRAALGNYGPDEWVRGYGWDESLWEEKKYLTAKDLDGVSSEQPIALYRIDGHLLSVNTPGLAKLKFSPDHEGVEKFRGKPTGVLKDMEDVFKQLRVGPAETLEGVEAGNKIANMHGITAAVDNVSAGYLRQIRVAERQGRLSTRMIVNPPSEQMKHLIEIGLDSGMGSPLLRIGGVKSFLDGSIGARTAYLSEDYSDDKGNKGRLLIADRTFRRFIRTAVENGIQTVNHAIGDAALDIVISAFEDLDDNALVREQRHRIEHAEMISEDQIRRAVSLGLILSLQPNFIGEWGLRGGMYYDRLGKERVETMHMFRVALDNGARICFGSDGMPYGPLYGIWCATNPPFPEGEMTVEEALRCYTMESAYSVFMENNIGSLREGKRADLTVLSDNIMEIPNAGIKDVTVDMTIVGGIVEYSALGD
ncbi:MAG: amidohydrolase [Candidatus Thorarchaeota archaeon]|jgi:predicted amidohydrolase YtcJ